MTAPEQSPAATVLAASNLLQELSVGAEKDPSLSGPFDAAGVRLLSELLSALSWRMRQMDAMEVQHPDGSRMVIGGGYSLLTHDANHLRADFGDWTAALAFAREVLGLPAPELPVGQGGSP